MATSSRPRATSDPTEPIVWALVLFLGGATAAIMLGGAIVGYTPAVAGEHAGAQLGQAIGGLAVFGFAVASFLREYGVLG